MARLVLVPTPIGNLGDITVRATQVLREADTVAAEDTRHSRRLLEHLGLDRQLLRLDAHTITERAPALLEAEGTLAYITDAGTPGISDPGAELVRMAIASDLPVEVLPGATAFVPALVLSGLDTARFTFEGFLPRRGSARSARLAAISTSDATSIIYEAPNRVAATLGDLAAACGPDRPAAVSRELTKKFEETVRGRLADLAGQLAGTGQRGEFVICVAGAETAGPADGAKWRELAQHLAAAGLSGRTLREALLLAGASRNHAYELSLTAPAGKLQ